MAVSFLLAVPLAEWRSKVAAASSRGVAEKIGTVLTLESRWQRLAEECVGREKFLFLGRGAHCVVAMHATLKLKERTSPRVFHSASYDTGRWWSCRKKRCWSLSPPASGEMLGLCAVTRKRLQTYEAEEAFCAADSRCE